MDSEQNLSRKFLGIHARGWLVIIVLIIISGGVVGYTMLNNKECIPVDFNVGTPPHLNQNFYYVGEEIPFQASLHLRKFRGTLMITRTVLLEKPL